MVKKGENKMAPTVSINVEKHHIVKRVLTPLSQKS